MIALLDTCTALWLATDHARLPVPVLEVLRDPSFSLRLSHVSAWEVNLKWHARKLALPAPPEPLFAALVAAHQLAWLGIELADIHATSSLPGWHTDPFDRLLVAQARRLGAAILTPDPSIARYDVTIIW